MAARAADLDALRAQEAAHSSAARAALAAERARVSAALARERAGLAAQLRAAYLIGRARAAAAAAQPARPGARPRACSPGTAISARARAAQIAGSRSRCSASMSSMPSWPSRQQRAGAAAHTPSRSQLAQLESGRAQRQVALTSLQSRGALARGRAWRACAAQQADLEHLLRELQRPRGAAERAAGRTPAASAGCAGSSTGRSPGT